MNQKRKQGKTTLIILSLICIVLIGISIIGSSVTSPVTGFTGMIITPIQKGMNQLGTASRGEYAAAESGGYPEGRKLQACPE